MEQVKDLDNLVELVIKEGASDLHISEGRPPIIRIAGSLVPLTKHPVFERDAMQKILDTIIPETKQETFKKRRSVDFAYEHGTERFRSHAFFQQGKMCLAMRAIPKDIRTLTELNLPETL